MRHKTALALSALCIVFMTAAAAADPLTGTWTGHPAAGATLQYVFRPDRTVIWRFTAGGKTREVRGRYTFDGSARPARLDISDFKPARVKDTVFLGIVQFLSKDRMLLCGTHSTHARPSARPRAFGRDGVELTRTAR